MSPRRRPALNTIEIEFSSGGGSDKRVFDAWRLYLDHLNDHTVDENNKDAVARWSGRCDDLLTDLLYEMSEALGFKFDKVALKKGIYSPKAHGELEFDQYMLRKFLVEVLSGKRMIYTGIVAGDKPIPMEIVNLPGAAPKVLRRADLDSMRTDWEREHTLCLTLATAIRSRAGCWGRGW